ncbi:hypothetical protein EON63_04360 [archaeon]|nr:MAG: hypothetical protein EON63_04360 [archaeon]
MYTLISIPYIPQTHTYTHTHIHTQWFLDKIGHTGLNNLLCAYEDKSAYAQCIFSLCLGDQEDVQVFVGRTHGKIVPARYIVWYMAYSV